MAIRQDTTIEGNQQLRRGSEPVVTGRNLNQAEILFLRLALKQSQDPVSDGLEVVIPGLRRCLSRLVLDTTLILKWYDLALAQLISVAVELGEPETEKLARRLMQHLVRKYSEAA